MTTPNWDEFWNNLLKAPQPQVLPPQQVIPQSFQWAITPEEWHKITHPERWYSGMKGKRGTYEQAVTAGINRALEGNVPPFETIVPSEPKTATELWNQITSIQQPQVSVIPSEEVVTPVNLAQIGEVKARKAKLAAKGGAVSLARAVEKTTWEETLTGEDYKLYLELVGQGKGEIKPLTYEEFEEYRSLSDITRRARRAAQASTAQMARMAEQVAAGAGIPIKIGKAFTDWPMPPEGIKEARLMPNQTVVDTTGAVIGNVVSDDKGNLIFQPIAPPTIQAEPIVSIPPVDLGGGWIYIVADDGKGYKVSPDGYVIDTKTGTNEIPEIVGRWITDDTGKIYFAAKYTPEYTEKPGAFYDTKTPIVEPGQVKGYFGKHLPGEEPGTYETGLDGLVTWTSANGAKSLVVGKWEIGPNDKAYMVGGRVDEEGKFLLGWYDQNGIFHLGSKEAIKAEQERIEHWYSPLKSVYEVPLKILNWPWQQATGLLAEGVTSSNDTIAAVSSGVLNAIGGVSRGVVTAGIVMRIPVIGILPQTQIANIVAQTLGLKPWEHTEKLKTLSEKYEYTPEERRALGYAIGNSQYGWGRSRVSMLEDLSKGMDVEEAIAKHQQDFPWQSTFEQMVSGVVFDPLNVLGLISVGPKIAVTIGQVGTGAARIIKVMDVGEAIVRITRTGEAAKVVWRPSLKVLGGVIEVREYLVAQRGLKMVASVDPAKVARIANTAEFYAQQIGIGGKIIRKIPGWGTTFTKAGKMGFVTDTTEDLSMVARQLVDAEDPIKTLKNLKVLVAGGDGAYVKLGQVTKTRGGILLQDILTDDTLKLVSKIKNLKSWTKDIVADITDDISREAVLRGKAFGSVYEKTKTIQDEVSALINGAVRKRLGVGADDAFTRIMGAIKRPQTWVFLGTPRYVQRNLMTNWMFAGLNSQNPFKNTASMLRYAEARGIVPPARAFGTPANIAITQTVSKVGVKGWMGKWLIPQNASVEIERRARQGIWYNSFMKFSRQMAKAAIDDPELISITKPFPDSDNMIAAIYRTLASGKESNLEALKLRPGLGLPAQAEAVLMPAYDIPPGVLDELGKIINAGVLRIDEPGYVAGKINKLKVNYLEKANADLKRLDLPEIVEEEYASLIRETKGLVELGLSKDDAWLQTLTHYRDVYETKATQQLWLTEMYRQGIITTKEQAVLGKKIGKIWAEEYGFRKPTGPKEMLLARARKGEVSWAEYNRTRENMVRTAIKRRDDLLQATIKVKVEEAAKYGRPMPEVAKGIEEIVNHNTSVATDAFKVMKYLDEFTDATPEYLMSRRLPFYEGEPVKAYTYNRYVGAQLTEENFAEWNKLIDEYQGILKSTRAAADSMANRTADWVLHNYEHTYDFDYILNALAPWEFWTTRTIPKLLLEMADRPYYFSNFARFREAAFESDANLPERLKHKMKIYAPYLPDWAGDLIFVDPTSMFFPLTDMLNPYVDQEKVKTGIGKIFTMFENTGIAVNPLLVGILASTGVLGENVKRLGPFPFTPQEQMLAVATAAMGVGGPWGVQLREYPYQTYYIEREIANMAADKTITPQEAKMALLSRAGDVWDKASRRAALETYLRWGTSLIGGIGPVAIYPTGEELRRELSDNFYQAMRDVSSGAHPEALDVFFEAHPEYTASTWLFKTDDQRRALAQWQIDDKKFKEGQRRNEENLQRTKDERAFLNERMRLIGIHQEDYKKFQTVMENIEPTSDWETALDEYWRIFVDKEGIFRDANGYRDDTAITRATNQYLASLPEQVKEAVWASVQYSRTPAEQRYYNAVAQLDGLSKEQSLLEHEEAGLANQISDLRNNNLAPSILNDPMYRAAIPHLNDAIMYLNRAVRMRIQAKADGTWNAEKEKQFENDQALALREYGIWVDFRNKNPDLLLTDTKNIAVQQLTLKDREYQNLTKQMALQFWADTLPKVQAADLGYSGDLITKSRLSREWDLNEEASTEILIRESESDSKLTEEIDNLKEDRDDYRERRDEYPKGSQDWFRYNVKYRELDSKVDRLVARRSGYPDLRSILSEGTERKTLANRLEADHQENQTYTSDIARRVEKLREDADRYYKEVNTEIQRLQALGKVKEGVKLDRLINDLKDETLGLEMDRTDTRIWFGKQISYEKIRK